jgi:hypothetical protein
LQLYFLILNNLLTLSATTAAAAAVAVYSATVTVAVTVIAPIGLTMLSLLPPLLQLSLPMSGALLYLLRSYYTSHVPNTLF